MSLHQKRRFNPFGLPEFIGLVLLTAVVFFGVEWLHASPTHRWNEAIGHITNCDIQSIHYNAEPNQNKVSISYIYRVNEIPFQGSWSGMWPETDSPNSLSDEEITQLKNSEYVLRVFYNPQNPEINRIHDLVDTKRYVFSILSVLGILVVIYYLVIVYPRWKGIH